MQFKCLKCCLSHFRSDRTLMCFNLNRDLLRLIAGWPDLLRLWLKRYAPLGLIPWRLKVHHMIMLIVTISNQLTQIKVGSRTGLRFHQCSTTVWEKKSFYRSGPIILNIAELFWPVWDISRRACAAVWREPGMKTELLVSVWEKLVSLKHLQMVCSKSDT